MLLFIVACKNRLICIITSNTKFCRISPLYKNLKLLKLADLYNFELAKFFYLLIHDELPSGNFTKIQQIHDHNTRRSKEIAYFVPRFSKSLGQNHNLHRGTKLWNELNKNLKKMHFMTFKKIYKNYLVASYSIQCYRFTVGQYESKFSLFPVLIIQLFFCLFLLIFLKMCLYLVYLFSFFLFSVKIITQFHFLILAHL